MTAKILDVVRIARVDITAYKLVRPLAEGGYRSEYKNDQRARLDGWKYAVQDVNAPVFDSGETLTYHHNEETRSPGGPGIMVYTDAPKSLSPYNGLKTWLLVRIPAGAKYRIGAEPEDNGREVLCVERLIVVGKMEAA